MATHTIGFAVADEDREQLDRLVERFGGGNRSAYLRATLRVMEAIAVAEELREVQAASQARLAVREVRSYEDALRLYPQDSEPSH